MKKLIFLSLSVCLSVAITGCGDSSIDTVKSSKPNNSNFNFSQIFDNGPICKKTKWASSSDEYKRKIVTMGCDFSISKSALDEVKNKKIALINNSAEKNLSTFDTYQKTIKERIVNLKAAAIEVNVAYDHNRAARLIEEGLTEESVKGISNEDFYESDTYKSHLIRIEDLEKELARQEARELEYSSHHPHDREPHGSTYGEYLPIIKRDVRFAQIDIKTEKENMEANKKNYIDEVHMLKNSSKTVDPDLRDEWYNNAHRKYYDPIPFNQNLKAYISTRDHNESIADEYIQNNTAFNKNNTNKITDFVSKEVTGKIHITFIVNDEFVEMQDISLNLFNKKIVNHDLNNHIYKLLMLPSSDKTIKSWSAFTANLSFNELKLEDFNFICDGVSGRCDKTN